MQLKKFYKKIQNKKVRYFFNSKEIYHEIFKILSKLPIKKIDKILELGCGDMQNFHIFKRLKFNSYTAVDWINFKKKKLDSRVVFKKKSIQSIRLNNQFDIILSIGTLEHLKDPWKLIKIIRNNMFQNSKIIFSIPNYINPRGLILLTMKELFNKKISKSDVYFFKPNEIRNNLKKIGFKNISIKTIKQNETYGKIAILDLKQRLLKILEKTKKKGIKKLLDYFKIYSDVYNPNELSGRVFLVIAEKK